MKKITIQLKRSDFSIFDGTCSNYWSKAACPLARACKRHFGNDTIEVGCEIQHPFVEIIDGRKFSYDGSVWNKEAANKIAKELSSWKRFFKKFEYSVSLTVVV